MKSKSIRLAKLIFGLFLYAVGIVVTMNANLGYAPWEVFHSGIAGTIGLTIGVVSMITGLIICIGAFLLGEKLGLGTLMNMVLIGIFIDLILWLNWIPHATGYVDGVALMLAGLMIIGFGSYFYINAQFGAGPRDSLMVALQRRTGLPVGVCRSMMEVAVTLIGWLLGGKVGLGTVLSAFAIGGCVQLVFRIVRFDATQVHHETLGDTFQKSRVQ